MSSPTIDLTSESTIDLTVESIIDLTEERIIDLTVETSSETIVKKDILDPLDFSLKFIELYEEMYKLSQDNGRGDPFNYARSKEIHLSCILGHTISTTLSGADAIDEDGECEYKTTINKNIQATYNGISVQPTWDAQQIYLKEEKICKYQNHYFARYEGAKIIDVYKMDCQKVYDGLMPHLKNKFEKVNKGKDPRLGYTLNKKYIIANSIKII